MAQNTSMAVMQQRVEPHDSLEDFPTPPWATRALMEFLISRFGREIGPRIFGGMICREPCANRGYMVRALAEYFGTVLASDIFDYGAGFETSDYLFGPSPEVVDWTITNPPFRLAEEFIARALETSRIGCAMLVRSAFLETVGRYDRIFSKNPPSVVLQFSERVVMHKGRIVEKGSTATAYCWLIWLHGTKGTDLEWVPPSRRSLERHGDYVEAA